MTTHAALLERCLPAGNSLPDVIHKIIRRDELGKGRLVIVGDIHGCLSELFKLLDALDFQYGHDNLLLTGDMCNKGPRPQEVRSYEYHDLSIVSNCRLQHMMKPVVPTQGFPTFCHIQPSNQAHDQPPVC